MSPLLVNMSFRVSKSLRHKFSVAAQKNDRNVSQLLRDYMRAYVELNPEAWFEEKANSAINPASSNKSPALSAAAREEAIRTERLKYRLSLIRPKKTFF